MFVIHALLSQKRGRQLTQAPELNLNLPAIRNSYVIKRTRILKHVNKPPDTNSRTKRRNGLYLSSTLTTDVGHDKVQRKKNNCIAAALTTEYHHDGCDVTLIYLWKVIWIATLRGQVTPFWSSYGTYVSVCRRLNVFTTLNAVIWIGVLAILGSKVRIPLLIGGVWFLRRAAFRVFCCRRCTCDTYKSHLSMAWKTDCRNQL